MSNIAVTYPIARLPSSMYVHPTIVARNADARKTWLDFEKASRVYRGDRRGSTIPPPCIAYSDFLPVNMVEFLMRNKKDASINVKWDARPDIENRITHLEGALHTFITPIMPAEIVGDYQWQGGHGIHLFGQTADGKHQLGRSVLLSALVQQDYENHRVMSRVVSCRRDNMVDGIFQLPDIPSVRDKQNKDTRDEYDIAIRRFLVYHLTHNHELPAGRLVVGPPSINGALKFVDDAIRHLPGHQVRKHMRNRFFEHGKCPCNLVHSLEMMFNAALLQMKNEFDLLEHMVPSSTGYVYTFQPPVIFVRYFNGRDSLVGTKLVSRLNILALKVLLSSDNLRGLKCISWGTFGDDTVIDLPKIAFANTSTQVLRNQDLFCGRKTVDRAAQVMVMPGDAKQELQLRGLYVAPRGCKHAMLVIHNNSDGFGQNIETEPPVASLDGVIGSYSSGAASLERTRKDLCQHLWPIACLEEM